MWSEVMKINSRNLSESPIIFLYPFIMTVIKIRISCTFTLSFCADKLMCIIIFPHMNKSTKYMHTSGNFKLFTDDTSKWHPTKKTKIIDFRLSTNFIIVSYLAPQRFTSFWTNHKINDSIYQMRNGLECPMLKLEW